ncbi:MAG: hypothetical protein KAG94_01445 [Clostridiales bacterium]|nr:hypothetical protein [Clostridiales bacterium]
MAKQILDVRATDNEYFHQDFHLSMNMLLDYILEKYGNEGVIEYLKDFTKAYHKPLRAQLKNGNLQPLMIYIKELYKKEKWEVKITKTTDKLQFSINSCPGMTYILSKKMTPSAAYIETYRTVYQSICEGTPFLYELIKFDKETGKSIHLFTRRDIK